MANKKITELDAITTLASTDVVPVVDVSADTTNKITTTNLFRSLPDGSAASPSLAFADDNNTGILSPAENQLAFATGGTQRVTIDGSGNVTISGGLTVEGQTTTVESTIVTIDDKNIELGSVASPSNTTADGGGITLKGATDKTIKWINSTGYWTFNTGIEVGGHLQIDDDDEIRLGTGQDLKIFHEGTDSFVSHAGPGHLYIRNTTDNKDVILQSDNSTGGLANYVVCDGSAGNVRLYYYGSQKLNTKTDGIDVAGEVECDSLDVDGTVDITGNVTLHANLDLQDNDRLNIGSGDDFTIRHNGTDTHIENDTGTLFITQYQDDSDIAIRTDNGSGAATNYILCDGSEGNVRLYHYGTQKLGTKSDGIDVTGEVQCDFLDVDGGVDIDGGQLTFDASNNRLNLADNVELRVGTGSDLRIYHNGTNTHISNTTGGLYIDQNLDDGDIILRSDDGSGSVTNYIACDGSAGEVRLYHYGSEKLNTKSDGIDVAGEVQCDSLDVDGAADITGTLTLHSHLDLQDSDHIKLGSDDDVEIYFDGTDGVIRQLTGNHLYIQNLVDDKDVIIRSDNGSGGLAFYVQCDGSNGEVRLYHYGTEKFNTKSDGVLVHGELECNTLDVNGIAIIGASDTSDAQLEIGSGATGNRNAYVDLIGDTTYTDYGLRLQRDNGGANGASKILHRGTGDFRLVAQEAAAMEFFTSNLERLRIDSSGRILIGTTTEGQSGAENLTLAGSGFSGMTIRSGTAEAGQIAFSDGTSGADEYRGQIYYHHGDDYMRFRTDSVERLRITSTGAWAIEGASNYGTSGQVLTSNGNDAPSWQDAGSGSVGGANAISMNDSVKINFGASSDLQIFHNGSNSFVETSSSSTGDLFISAQGTNHDLYLQATDDIFIRPQGGENAIVCTGNGGVFLYYDAIQKLGTKSDGVDITGELECDSLDVDGSGDITGTLTLHDHLDMQDDDFILMGSGDDFKLHHNGSNSHIQNYTGGLYIDQHLNDGNLVLRSDNGSGGLADYVTCQGSSGEVFLYHYGTQKFKTKSDGVDVTGEVQCDSLDVDGSGDFTGDVTFRGGAAAVNIAANSDIRLANGTWSGNHAAKIQHHSNFLYISGGTSGIIFREGGTDRIRMDGDGHFRPASNNTYDLGTASYRWRNVYTHDLHLSNEGQSNDVDGTWGNYTIQEGEDDLFLINRRNGKKYKFNLTEVS